MIEEESAPEGEPNYIAAIYGEVLSDVPLVSPMRKSNFAPWHHPIKQIVRDYQWGDLAVKFVKERRDGDRVVRYFTLPGSDLLDVRFLSTRLESYESQIEYFGFNVGYRPDSDVDDSQRETGAYFAAESALRQAGRTTSNAVILPDRLEDIAEPGSQAANRLKQQPVFDIVNIDACEHLGFVPEGRTRSLFDAMSALLAHQLRSEKPWLLFLTTRVSPDLLGDPGLRLQAAINDNLRLYPDEFGKVVASCIDGNVSTIGGDLAKSWSRKDHKFLKIYVVGLAKYLLQFYHGQPNLPADVELVSAFAYRVYDDQPDMLSVAFRITPRGMKVQPPSVGHTVVGGPLEIESAITATQRVEKLWNLEDGILDEEVKTDAVSGTIDLLDAANYDLKAWEEWLAQHRIRPMLI